MKNSTRAEELLNKYALGNCTEQELDQLHTWYLEGGLSEVDVTVAEVEGIKSNIWQMLPVHQGNKTTTKLNSMLWMRRIAVAASILLCITLGYYFNHKSNDNVELAKHEVILPGGNKAVLTLADGTKIDLANMNNGVLGNDHGTKIIKTNEGNIVYGEDENSDKKVVWNTLTIPVGGYYNVTLSDGTKVWLNAKSSLKYPTDFIGDERIVELDGEGYFEVAHNQSKPFKVITAKQTVEVLGTHFNINAYTDEAFTTTTLLEGRVKVLAAGQQKLLAPNQQTKLKDNSINIANCNAENAVDWVNNDFIFDSEPLETIMRKLSRWYNVEVSYPPTLAKLEFTGSISRSKNITQVLKIMELTGVVNFKVEGRRITVMQ
jgi:ferric-dicitrate binding protein FerR (iron transport regulator)